MREDYVLFIASLIFFVFAVFLYIKRENSDFEKLLHRLNGIQATADDACKAADAAKKNSDECRSMYMSAKVNIEHAQTQIIELQRKTEEPKPININLSSIPIEVSIIKPAEPDPAPVPLKPRSRKK
jgi:hypothetical protein